MQEPLVELWRFELQGRDATESRPHKVVRGVVYGADLTQDEVDRLRATLREATRQMHEDLTATVEVKS